MKDITLKKIKPLFTTVITTAELYEEPGEVNGVLDPEKMQAEISIYQKVIEVGTSVTGIKPGDLVMINPTRFAVAKHNRGEQRPDGMIEDKNDVVINWPVMELNHEPALYLDNRDIFCVVEDWEEA